MFKETKPNANWFGVQNWMLDKLVNTEGAIAPIDKNAAAKRPKPQLDYQVVLENASRTMIRFKKPERLIKMIVQVIDEQVHTSHTAVLLFKENKNAFVYISTIRKRLNIQNTTDLRKIIDALIQIKLVGNFKIDGRKLKYYPEK